MGAKSQEFAGPDSPKKRKITVKVKFELSHRPVLIVSFVTILVLVTAHLVLKLMELEDDEPHWLIVQMFDLDDENNFPTWFSSFMLMLTATVLYSLSGTKPDALQYRILALGFMYLSADEVAGFHESMNTAVDVNWAIPGGIAAILVGLYFVPFLLRQPPLHMALMLLSGGLYVGGAVGLELFAEDMDEESAAYVVAVAIEEGFEMLGVWLFLWTLLTQVDDST